MLNNWFPNCLDGIFFWTVSRDYVLYWMDCWLDGLLAGCSTLPSMRAHRMVQQTWQILFRIRYHGTRATNCLVYCYILLVSMLWDPLCLLNVVFSAIRVVSASYLGLICVYSTRIWRGLDADSMWIRGGFDTDLTSTRIRHMTNHLYEKKVPSVYIQCQIW